MLNVKILGKDLAEHTQICNSIQEKACARNIPMGPCRQSIYCTFILIFLREAYAEVRLYLVFIEHLF